MFLGMVLMKKILRGNNIMENETYDDMIEKIKQLLTEAYEKGQTMSYTELGEKLGVSPEYIKKIVGIRFTQLTKKAYNPFNDADPDFYLFGDNIKEICNNKQYHIFKEKKMKQLSKTGKFMGDLSKV
jgi:hypothetical protein